MPLLGIYLREMKSSHHTNICTLMFTAVLFLIPKPVNKFFLLYLLEGLLGLFLYDVILSYISQIIPAWLNQQVILLAIWGVGNCFVTVYGVCTMCSAPGVQRSKTKEACTVIELGVKWEKNVKNR